jgi:hypothetical protein
MRYKLSFITVLIALAFALSVPGQTPFSNLTIPFDFSDQYYKTHGILTYEIMSRRTGNDGISVFDKAPYDMYGNVRVLATVPAYDQFGQMLFWYPLGDLNYKSFTPDKIGLMAREKARDYPMYIFPDPGLDYFTTWTGHRHAPVIDITRQPMAGPAAYPMGIRMVYTVYYTERARDKDGIKLMAYIGGKNGWDAANTPILNNVDDIRFLENQGFVKVAPLWVGERDFHQPNWGYTLAPFFQDPTGGAIYPDAMLFMTLKDGVALDRELMFERQFNCLRKTGQYCDKDPAF